MRYAGIIYDDTAAAPGLCLSFYTQGCPIHCEGCHNPETWAEEGGYEFTTDTMDTIFPSEQGGKEYYDPDRQTGWQGLCQGQGNDRA